MTPTGEVERSRELALPHFPEIVPSLVGFFASRGIEAYLVGGAVRDALLGRDTRDVDVAVNTDTGDVGSDLASFLGGYVFPLDVETAGGDDTGAQGRIGARPQRQPVGIGDRLAKRAGELAVTVCVAELDSLVHS